MTAATTDDRDEETEDECPNCGATFGTFTGSTDLCMDCSAEPDACDLHRAGCPRGAH